MVAEIADAAAPATDAVDAAVPATDAADAAAAPAAASRWTECREPARGHVWFVNKDSHETAWALPPGGEVVDVMDEVVGVEAEAEAAAEAAAAAAAEPAAADGAAAPEPAVAPAATRWIEYSDDAGDVWYADEAQTQTVWALPEGGEVVARVGHASDAPADR